MASLSHSLTSFLKAGLSGVGRLMSSFTQVGLFAIPSRFRNNMPIEHARTKRFLERAG